MAWTTPKTFVTGDPLTAAELNTHLRDNLTELKDPPTTSYMPDEGSDYTTTSTSFVAIDSTNLSLAITTTGGDVLISFIGTAQNSVGSNQIFFDIFKDTDGGGYVALAGDDGMLLVQDATATIKDTFTISWLITGLAAGTHTFRPYWKVVGGTATLRAGAGTVNNDVHGQFWVREI